MSISDKIKKLKKENNAVIMAHNYQLPEVQDIADFVGDSLGLRSEATKTKADIIVFCGVHFMAETIKISVPHKKVLLPDENARCPMADMITLEDLKSLQDKHPDAATICYVNSSAATKALCDYCCTSSNALSMARDIMSRHKKIIFVPDKYLAQYVSTQVNTDFIMCEGYCPVHDKILPENIMDIKKLHPQAKVIVHPECKPSVTGIADVVSSTEGICEYVKSSKEKEFIIGTEISIIYRLKKENPDKVFYIAAETAVCDDMKRINLEKILWSLENLSYEITLPPDVMEKARICIETMI